MRLRQRPDLAALVTRDVDAGVDEEIQAALEIGFVELQGMIPDGFLVILPQFHYPAVGKVFSLLVFPEPFLQHLLDVFLGGEITIIVNENDARSPLALAAQTEAVDFILGKTK